jgi:hypothetical protein
MRDSEVYSRCKSAILSIALVTGYARPATQQHQFWGQQTVADPWSETEQVVATAVDVAAQLSESFSFIHPLSNLQSHLAPDVEAAIRWQCSSYTSGVDIPTERQKLMSTFRKCAHDLDGWSSHLSECSPHFIRCSPSPFPHYALFECCIDALDLPDDHLGEDLVCGAPCLGDIPDSGVHRPVRDPSSINIEDMDHREWHRQLVHDITTAASDPSRSAEFNALWARTLTEVDAGWAVEIGDLSEAEAFFHQQPFRAAQRFSVEQKGKLRPFENCRTALHNLATSLVETIVTDTADFPARAASLYAEVLGEAMFSMLLGTEDIASAYRRMPCSQPWFTVFAVWDPVRGSVRFFRLVGFNFGLRSAPSQFNRLSFAMARIAVRVLRLSCSNFYDDFCVVEPSFARGGQRLLREIAALLRVPFDGLEMGQGKSEAPGLSNQFLGVLHDFTSFPHTRSSLASVPPDTIEDIAASINMALEGHSLDSAPGGALKLCGRLQFCLSWACKRFGRAALQPIMASASSRSAPTTTEPVRCALIFLRDLLVDPAGKPRLRPRKFFYSGSRSSLPTVLIWSDARWESSLDRPAGIGFVVFFPASDDASRAARSARSPPWMMGASTPPGEWFYASYDVPSDDYAHWRVRDQYIGQLELLAAIAVYYSLADRLRGRRVIHCIDNTGAVACLIKDYSADTDSSMLVHSFWALAAALDVDVWFVFVNSAANIADWPSRGLTAFAADLGAARIEGDSLRLPPSSSWGSVEQALAHSGAGLSISRGRKRKARD